MSEQNPYRPPQAQVQDQVPAGTGEWQLGAPRSVSVGRGWSWIAEGFGLFAKDPLIWIVNCVIFAAIMFIISILPIVSLLFYILLAMFTGGFMRGCRVLDEGGRLGVGHLFAGFQHNAGQLAGVGGLFLVGSIASTAVVVAFWLMTGGLDTLMAFGESGPQTPGELLMMTREIGVAILVGLALLIPLIMMIWFASALVMLHDLGVIESMKLSFVACLRNILPFLVYGIIISVLWVVASIPIGLGLLVMIPVTFATMYTGYKDIFIAP